MATRPSLGDNLRHLLQEFTAGEPMREGVLWTNVSLRELSRRLAATGTPASRRTIRRALRSLEIGRRRPARSRRWAITPTATPSSGTLCDGGGSKSATQYLFEEDLQRRADRLGFELRAAHYPPYCSTHNPIEHQVFPHITRACRGVIFHTVEIARQFLARARTDAGLRVTASLLNVAYATGRKCGEGFRTAMKILFDAHLPKWNYRALPPTRMNSGSR